MADGRDSGDGGFRYSGVSGIEATLAPIPDIPQGPEPGAEVTHDGSAILGPSADSNPLGNSTDLERICSATLADVIECERQLLRFSDEMDYIGLNIGIALTYIQNILPSASRIFYVGFTGGKGSGKSTATSFCARVARDGVKLEGITYAALVNACNEKRTLCLDEFDSQSIKCPDLEMIVRQGIDLDAHYTKMAQDSKGKWRREDIPCGGMKFLNWRNPIDDAILQRILVIKMAPGASTRMIINNEAPERFTSPIRCWFAAQGAAARNRWTPEKVRELVEDRNGDLEKRLDNLLGKVPRQTQKAFWMLVICDMFAWDLDSTIKGLIEKQPEDETYDDYKELVVEIWRQRAEIKSGDGPVTLRLVDFKKDISQRIKDRGMIPLRHKGSLSWTGLRQECGFVEGVNEKKDSKASGNRVLVFDERVLRALCVDAPLQHRFVGSGEGLVAGREVPAGDRDGLDAEPVRRHAEPVRDARSLLDTPNSALDGRSISLDKSDREG